VNGQVDADPFWSGRLLQPKGFGESQIFLPTLFGGGAASRG
jgi:hypothetical protein